VEKKNMRAASHKSSESGVVLLTTLLILMMISALMVGFYAAVNSDVRAGAIDRDQTQAYAAAHAGLEKLTSNLAQLFQADVSPSSSQILNLATTPPAIPGFEYRAPGGAAGSGYNLVFSKTDVNGNPAPEDPLGSNITAGPYKGLKGIITKYPITITARSITGNAEVRLRRELQTVAVPVFQFGVFSETDLSIYAGENFAFGGRVHSNGSLFLCHQTNLGTMTFNDRITAFREVVRNYWSNGLANASTSPSCTNNVLIPTSASTNRNLRQSPNEGSVAGMPGTAENGSWKNISQNTYKGYIRTGATGANRLDLPLVSEGAQPVDLIRRPLLDSNENIAEPAIFGQRFFAQASLRILLSDRIADISGLPTVTAADPILLDGNWNTSPPTGYGPVDATHPPIARSPGPISVNTKSSSCCSTGSGVQTIKTQTAIPAEFKAPANLTIGGFVNPCTGKNATQFTGCTFSSNPASGAAVTATLPSGVVVSTTTSGSVSGSGTSKTVTINTPAGTVSTFRTAPFSVNTFFIDGKLYTCTGYDATPQFTGCNDDTTPDNSAAITTNALANIDTGTIGGYIKIEKQSAAGVWTDVTMEILNLGIGDRNQPGIGTQCADPTPNAVLRIQRLRDNAGSDCPYPASTNAKDWWPQTLYDAREGSIRDPGTSGLMTMGGVIQYVALDVNNLKKWFAGTTGTTGTVAFNNNGYIVYFSDRRGNHHPGAAISNAETGEFGYEDQVNSTTSAGTPDGVLQAGEDMNGDGTQQTYGKTPSTIGGNIPAGSTAPYDATLSNAAGTTGSSPWRTIIADNAGQTRVNKVVLFRRALKLINGVSSGATSLPVSGLTVATENPAYVQGNYNTTSHTASETHRPASVIADSITLLSNAWSDHNSFYNPNDVDQRVGTTTYWRFAAIAGKSLSFPYCGSACGNPPHLYGTDGGVANFLRLLEKWFESGQSLNYRGSLVTLHNSRQAVGTFRFPNSHIYTGGTRNFAFDVDFLTPSLLPPGTPMFRDINTLTFRQILRPTQ
jgi:hypothetical protein